MSESLPNNDGAERALLGRLLIDPEALRRIRIRPGDFYIERNRWIYEAMIAITARHETPDYALLCDELSKTGRMKEIGGAAYVTKLVEDTPRYTTVESYAEILRGLARRRRIVIVASELVRQAVDQKTDIDEVIARAASDLVSTVENTEGAHHIRQVVSELYDEIVMATENPREYFGVPTGLRGFDDITYGLQRGEVFMLSGEPGVGKSFLAMQLGVGAASGVDGRDGTPGAVYQLEMSEIAVVRRTLSERSRVPVRTMRQGKVNEDDWRRILEAIEIISMLPIYICDDSQLTTLDLRADLARLITHGVGWCIIDYMALLKDEPGLPETERMGLISDRVHDIAKDLDIAIIALHDMTKGAQTGVVKGQAGLAGHRRVGYNADQTAFLRETKDKNIFNLEWEKFREDSPDRVLQLRRVPGFPAYAEVAPDEPAPVKPRRSSGRVIYPST